MKNSILLLLLFLNISHAQTDSFCGTIAPSTKFITDTKSALSANLLTDSNIKEIRVYVYIIRDSQGNGGQPKTRISEALQLLSTAFETYDVCFSLVGVNEIHDNNLYNFSFPLFESYKPYFSQQSKSYALTLFLFPDHTLNMGIAEDIPGSYVIIGGSQKGRKLIYSPVLSHEVGHTFGLYHTHHPWDMDEPKEWPADWCYELVSGSNCLECGDWHCDTPADPNMSKNVDTTSCVWDFIADTSAIWFDENGDHYDPDTYNIMSYSVPQCLSYFSIDQGSTMNSTISSSPTLQEILLKDIETINDYTVDSLEISIRHARDSLYFDGTALIESAGIATLTAGNIVKIKPGFHAFTGSDVSIYIHDSSCNIDL